MEVGYAKSPGPWYSWNYVSWSGSFLPASQTKTGLVHQKMQRGSSCLYTALRSLTSNNHTIRFLKTICGITFKYCQMPKHLVSVLQGLNHADEYTMLDRDKRANEQPSFGVKQGCPITYIRNTISYISSMQFYNVTRCYIGNWSFGLGAPHSVRYQASIPM